MIEQCRLGEISQIFLRRTTAAPTACATASAPVGIRDTYSLDDMGLKPLAEHQFHRPTTPGLDQQTVACVDRLWGDAVAGPGPRCQSGFAPADGKFPLAEQSQQEGSSRLRVIHRR